MFRISSGVWLVYATVAFLLTSALEVVGQNRVLELDGNDSYIEFPADLLKDVDRELTVEGWIRWQQLGRWSRFFDFGPPNRSLAVAQFYDTADMNAVVHGPLSVVRIWNILRTNHWYHIACTISEGGTRVYINGVLAGTERFVPNFDQFRAGPHRLGRSYNEGDQEGHRQIDEFRVWSVARTGAQIRETMWEKLTGREPGLLGYWNFDGGDVRDLSSAQRHGLVRGRPRFPANPSPQTADLVAPARVVGTVRETDGSAMAFSKVQLKKLGGESFDNLNGEGSSDFQFTVFNPDGSYVLTAALGDRSITREGLRLQSGQTLQLNLSFADPGSISGTLRMFDQSPHVAVPVQALGASNQVVATVLS